jgi:chromosome segregation ATPase
MRFRSEPFEQDAAPASDIDNFDLETFFADLDKARAAQAAPPPPKPSASRQVGESDIEDVIVSFETEIERCVSQLAAVGPFVSDLRRVLDDFEGTRAALERQAQSQANKLAAAERLEQSLRDEIAMVTAELARARGAQTEIAGRLEKVTALCRAEHAAKKVALGARDEMEVQMKRHEAGQAAALQRVAELSKLNEELEARLRLPIANPRPVPQLQPSEFTFANLKRLAG